MTLLEVHQREHEVTLLDLEGQTTPIARSDAPARVMMTEAVVGYVGAVAQRVGIVVSFASATAPDITVWDTVKHEPLSLGHLRRRDHAFTWANHLTPVQYFDPQCTPVAVVDDISFVRFDTCRDLLFRNTRDQWRDLLADYWEDDCSPDELAPTEEATPPVAWTVFEELRDWLHYTDLETSRLLGLGDKTAYGWRREGRPPQARLARRLYETHAFVRQLVEALGENEARRALAQEGDDSALALIGANRVAEAEARFADVIYSRPVDRLVMGASRSGDEDLPTGTAPERLPGGRRSVRARRRR